MSRVEALIARARAATSLEDFGEDSFREGLQRLVESRDREARLNEVGKAATDQQTVDLLSERLRVEHWYRLHPEIDEQEIVAPLIGLGLPRTGSSALSCLLGEDPATRSLRTWETQSPTPPPGIDSAAHASKIAAMEAAFLVRNARFPRLRQMLPSTPTAPSECQMFMAMDFKSQLFQSFAQIPSYADWLNNEADLLSTYRYVKRVLKLLQWRCPPKRWRLKNPTNILFITALDQVFPDARFWMTHRDVASVVPSCCDLHWEMIRAFTAEVDKHLIGRLNAEWCELGMRRVIAFREAGNDHRFFDIHFAPFQHDPMAEVERLYRWLGEELTDEARTRMEQWRQDMPREKHGAHHYSGRDFGLESSDLHARFKFYSDRFGVALKEGELA